MSKREANKIIRDYVKQNGRVMLREKLSVIAKDFPGNEQIILEAGEEFLKI